MNRRTLLAGTGALGLASLSGCLGAAGLDTHESSPAGVERPTLEETGYDQTGIEPIGVTEEFSLVLYTESVSVTNYLTEHEKSVDMGPLGSQRAAVFMVLTTPQVSVVGQEFNPVEEMSAEELVELVQDNYDEIGNVEREEAESVSVLDQETSMTRFSADAQFDGEDVDVLMHVTEAVQTDGDHLVVIGVYPEMTRSQEESNVHALVEGIIEEAHDDGESDGGDGDDADDGGDDDGDSGDEDDGGDEDTDEDEDDDDGGIGL